LILLISGVLDISTVAYYAEAYYSEAFPNN